MKRLSAVTALAIAAMAPVLFAQAATQFVQDGASLFSQGVAAQLNGRLTNFNAQTGKEVVVVTVPSMPSGQTVSVAAENAFAQQQINGTLIYISKNDRKAYVLPDRAAVRAGWFTASTSTSIAQSMAAQFKDGNYDAGITGAVGSVLDIYRSHLSSLQRPGSNSAASAPTQARAATSGGVHIGVFWWIVIIFIGYLIIRSIMRAMSGTRYGAGGPIQPGAPGYGGPGYGGGYGGYGGYGGGGGFWSGLLGGLGGAFLGNELFRGGGFGGGLGGGSGADTSGGQQQSPTDGGGWQSDPGQADPSAGGGGDWGGGGFGDLGGGGGGGGDFGGGGGGGGDGGGGGSW